VLPGNAMRVTIIDAEAKSVPFLKGLERGDPPRAWITRFPESMLAGKEVTGLTAWAPYRDGDEIRMGCCVLNDPDSMLTDEFPVRIIQIRRRTKRTVTTLGASRLLDQKWWTAIDVADGYFARWPCQEANFRAVSQATRSKQVHGYGKMLVDNITVIKELEKIANQRPGLEQLVAKGEAATQHDQAESKRVHRDLEGVQRKESALATRLDASVREGVPVTRRVRQMLSKDQALRKEIKGQERLAARVDDAAKTSAAKLQRAHDKLAKNEKREKELEGRQKIFKHDVELDSLFTLLEVNLVLLVNYVLREFFGQVAMDPATFLDRVATLPARLHRTPQLEIVTFFYNHRDPEVMALLAERAPAINRAGLRLRSGLILRVEVDPPPPPPRPPPDRDRTKSGRWTTP
jgi:hypothetical protein